MTTRVSFPRKLESTSKNVSNEVPKKRLKLSPLPPEERESLRSLIENEHKSITSQATFWVPPRKRKSKTA